jgi:antitoxin MazE
MLTTLQKWGNSKAIRIPKIILEEAKIKEEDQVDIKVVSGNIVIEPVKRHRTLKERIQGYSGDYNCAEWDTGALKGNEIL